MFGLFKKPQFEDHLKRLEKLLWAAFEKIQDAQGYLSGMGIGSDNLKMKSADGAIQRSIGKLNESMWLAEQAIKTSNGEHEKLDMIVDVVDALDQAIPPQDEELFHSELRRRWKEGFSETWVNQFNGMLPSDYSRRAKAT
jgi:hypothetical protein